MKDNWKISEIVWLILSTTITILASYFTNATLASSIASVCGVVYVILIAKQKKIAYLFGIINVVIYGIILYNDELYGSSIYNLAYSVPFLIYGYFAWDKMQKKNKTLVIKRHTRGNLIALVFLSLVGVVVYSICAYMLGAKMFVIDAITVCIGAIGVYLMTNAYIEQWYSWIVVNSVSLIYWCYLSYLDYSNAPLAIMWAIYLTNSAIGLYRWKKAIKK